MANCRQLGQYLQLSMKHTCLLSPPTTEQVLIPRSESPFSGPPTPCTIIDEWLEEVDFENETEDSTGLTKSALANIQTDTRAGCRRIKVAVGPTDKARRRLHTVREGKDYDTRVTRNSRGGARDFGQLITTRTLRVRRNGRGGARDSERHRWKQKKNDVEEGLE